ERVRGAVDAAGELGLRQRVEQAGGVRRGRVRKERVARAEDVVAAEALAGAADRLRGAGGDVLAAVGVRRADQRLDLGLDAGDVVGAGGRLQLLDHRVKGALLEVWQQRLLPALAVQAVGGVVRAELILLAGRELVVGV